MGVTLLLSCESMEAGMMESMIKHEREKVGFIARSI